MASLDTHPHEDPRESLRELLERARDNDRQALDALLAKIQPIVFRFGQKMCRHDEDAREVLQETLLAASRTIANFRGDASINTWLFTIARSFCIKKRRRTEPPTTGLDDASEVSGGSTPHEIVEQAQLTRAVEKAMERLDPTYREVLLLRDIEGLSAKETADVIGVTVEAIKSRLHRARTTLRDLLQKELQKPSRERTAKCPDIAAMFSAKIEGELETSICEQVEEHVRTCPRCAEECESFMNVLASCEAIRSKA